MLSLRAIFFQISRKDFEDIYKMLDISLTERGESYYNDVIPIVLNDLVNKNIAIESDGALCIFENEDEPPLICRKSDGGFNYASTDLAALWQVRTFSQIYKWDDECPAEQTFSV